MELSDGLKLKLRWFCFLQTRNLWLHKTLTDGLEWCGLLVDYCSVLSAVWTFILMTPIHCRASIAELHFTISDLETKSSASWTA